MKSNENGSIWDGKTLENFRNSKVFPSQNDPSLSAFCHIPIWSLPFFHFVVSIWNLPWSRMKIDRCEMVKLWKILESPKLFHLIMIHLYRWNSKREIVDEISTESTIMVMFWKCFAFIVKFRLQFLNASKIILDRFRWMLKFVVLG